MNSIDSLFSCHDDLSNLTNRLQYHRELLINDPYLVMLQSSNTKPSNSFYFPYYSMVEQYISFTEECNNKLNQFKQLLLESLANHTNDENNNTNDTSSENENENENENICTPTPSIMYDDTYLPTIDEDKETVYSYNSYNLSTNYSLATTVIDIDTDTDIDTDIDSQYDNDLDNDSDDEYVYSDDSDDDSDDTQWHSKVKKQFIFNEAIYCNTLIYIKYGNGNGDVSENDIRNLFLQIGGINNNYVSNIICRLDFNGFYYYLVSIKYNINVINQCINNICKYSNNNNLNIVINVFNQEKYNSDYYLNMKQSNKLLITHFDILNGNIYYDLIKLLNVFGEIKNIQIFTNQNDNEKNNIENDPYALVEFKCIRDAVRLFDAHNINMTVTGYMNSLYLGKRLLKIKYKE